MTIHAYGERNFKRYLFVPDNFLNYFEALKISCLVLLGFLDVIQTYRLKIIIYLAYTTRDSLTYDIANHLKAMKNSLCEIDDDVIVGRQ